MRKTALAFMVLALLFTGCSKSDSDQPEPTIKIAAKSTEINYDETTQMSVNVGSATDYTWISSDEFVGTIDANGVFTAAHIGNTTITAEKNGKQATEDITVNPKQTLFDEPFMLLGASKSEIKAKETREIAGETENVIGYKDPSASIRAGILYEFDDDGKLSAVVIPLTETSSNATKIGTFYDERYQLIANLDGTFVFSEKDKKYSVALQANNEDLGFAVFYLQYIDPNTNESAIKSRVNSVRKRAIKSSFN